MNKDGRKTDGSEAEAQMEVGLQRNVSRVGLFFLSFSTIFPYFSAFSYIF